MKTRLLLAALAVGLPLSAGAEEFEVKMLNRGEAGAMVFEPALVEAQVGDTVVFVPTDRGHNAQSIDGFVPEGQEAVKGGMNKEVRVELTAPGLMLVKCKPHFSMGMVMAIITGDPELPEDVLDSGKRIPRRARQRFEEALEGHLGSS